jgi:hypothetical protein
MATDYKSVLERILSDPRYLKNLDWGKPREGHPEGTVRAHIAELERNLETLRPRLSEEEYWKLRLLIHTHDTFKGEATPNSPITDPNSHASLARAYLASFCDDADLLAMVQYHDEPYALWRQLDFKGKFNQNRFDALLQKIKDWNLFLAFMIIDGSTEGKSRKPLEWFIDEVSNKVSTRFTSADIIK